MNYIHAPSLNFDPRDPALPLRYIVLHYTGMKSGNAALLRLRDPASKVSAHYMIEEDGRVFILVDESRRAWHAGESFWQGVTDINSASVGIELVNPGHQNGYRPFPDAQIAALKKLLHEIVTRHRMDAKSCILGHSDIAPGRKEDPGELFPWENLAKDGLGLWPKVLPADYGTGDPEDGEVQKLLMKVGYRCPDTKAYDRETRAALIAFQRRFEPDMLTGTPEKETVARLRALARLL